MILADMMMTILRIRQSYKAWTNVTVALLSVPQHSGRNLIVNVSAKWTGDISGDRDGNTFSLGFDKRWMLGQQVMLSPRNCCHLAR
ncbi:hypothetical protein P4S73_01125 [Paraglaciecola sp. Hal342]